MKNKKISIIIFTLVFFVGALSAYQAEKITNKTVKGEAKKNLDGKVIMPTNSNCYRSKLTYDNSYSTHQTIFKHNLGRIPTTVTVFFTDNGEDFYRVTCRWPALTANPISIKVTKDYIYLEIFSSIHVNLFTAWRAEDDKWMTWEDGYWYVTACK